MRIQHSRIREVNSFLLSLANIGIILSMAVIAVVIPYSVFARYVLKDMPSWSEEIAMYCLVWASMLGAAVSLHKGYQVGITTLIEKTPRRIGIFLQWVAFAFLFFFFSIALFYSTVQTVVNLRQRSPAMGLPMALPYAALPIGFFLMILVTAEQFLLFLSPADLKE